MGVEEAILEGPPLFGGWLQSGRSSREETRSAVVCDDDPVDPTVRQVLKQTGPEYTSSFETEMWALLLAVEWLRDFGEAEGRYLICSDSQSSLSALAGGVGKSHTLVVGLKERLKGVPGLVEFQWIPGHCGLSGNERADQEAKGAANPGPGQNPLRAPLSLESVRSHIPSGVRDAQPDPVSRRQVLEVYKGKKGSTQGLCRKDEVMLAQMRSGQSKHLAAYRAKILGEDPMCPKCDDGREETLEHYWRECPATENLRRTIFETVPPPLSVLWTHPKEALRYCEGSNRLSR